MATKQSRKEKLNTVYQNLTIAIIEQLERYPDMVDALAVHMRDFENIINEVNGYGEAEPIAPLNRGKTH